MNPLIKQLFLLITFCLSLECFANSILSPTPDPEIQSILEDLNDERFAIQ